MTQVARADFERLDARSMERTPQGGLRVPARMTRTGVFLYRNADGTTRRELRHPSEVFHADSLRSLDDAPVTHLHPSGLITPETYKRDSVGHVRPGSRRDGRFVTGHMVVQDAETVEGVERRDLQEVSLGYVCELDPTPGVYEGEHYDAVQRRIRYNHAALGPANWGRAGSDVSLRFDSAGVAAVQRPEDPAPSDKPSRRHVRTDTMKTIRIDGVDYEVGSDAHLQAQAKRDARLEGEIETLTERADKAEAARDEAIEARDVATRALEEAKDPARFDAAIADRVALVEGARKVLGTEWKHDGKDEATIIAETLAKAKPELSLEGRTDGYLRARFDAAVEAAVAPQASTSSVQPTPSAEPRTTTDNDPDKARLDMIERNRNAWQQPLAVSLNQPSSN